MPICQTLQVLFPVQFQGKKKKERPLSFSKPMNMRWRQGKAEGSRVRQVKGDIYLKEE